MTFEHKFSTRHPMYWVITPIGIVFGGFITLLFVAWLFLDGFEFGALLGLTVGLMFLFVGLYSLYRIISPKIYTTIITKEMITCKTNDDITFQVNKEDIESIFVPIEEDMDYIYIKMKTKNQRKFPFSSLVDFVTFRDELMLHNYPLGR